MPGYGESSGNENISGYDDFYLGDRQKDVIRLLHVRGVPFHERTVAYHNFIDMEIGGRKITLIFNYAGFLYAINVQTRLSEENFGHLNEHLNEKYGEPSSGISGENSKHLLWETGDRYSLTVSRGSGTRVYLYYVDNVFYKASVKWKPDHNQSQFNDF
ncbi:MAG: hypothetical protein ACOCWZ_07500 [Spirochaetota bacterium]